MTHQWPRHVIQRLETRTVFTIDSQKTVAQMVGHSKVMAFIHMRGKCSDIWSVIAAHFRLDFIYQYMLASCTYMYVL